LEARLVLAGAPALGCVHPASQALEAAGSHWSCPPEPKATASRAYARLVEPVVALKANALTATTAAAKTAASIVLAAPVSRSRRIARPRRESRGHFHMTSS